MTTKPKPAAKVAAKANSRVREAVFETVSAFQAVDSIGQVKVPNAEIRAAMEESHAKVQAVKMAAVLVSRDPDILGGTPVFKGTRVPVAVLFENLGDGKSLDEILISYPTLSRETVLLTLKLAQWAFLNLRGHLDDAEAAEQSEFIRRGSAAIERTVAADDGLPVEEVIAKLEAKIAVARKNRS
jgi:uncharacterized protein (DUF433 family)